MQPHDLATAESSWATAVLLHPHPDMGGDRFNNVVSALFDALPANGVTALRFDFGSSNVEMATAQTVEALDLVGPAFLVGYSFGGGIASKVVDERIMGRCLIAPPTTMLDQRDFVIAAEHDQFFAPDDLSADVVVSGADHFFAGRTDEVAKQCLAWIRQVAR